MKYVCSKCMRTLEMNEVLSFCPFCGNAYQAAASTPSVMQIVVASDSERAIQEKYWNRARELTSDALHKLRTGLPRFSQKRRETEEDEKTPEQYQTQMLKPLELAELAHCTSAPIFRKKLMDILAAVEMEFQVKCTLKEIGQTYIGQNRTARAEHRATMMHGEWSAAELEDAYSIDIDAEEAFIRQFCTDLAENFGNMSPERLWPELDFDMDSLEWPNDEVDDKATAGLFALCADYASLWKEIQDSAAALTSALESNGLFALTLVHGEAREDFEAKQCAQDLQHMKNADYDPIFGESIEAFTRAFFDGLAALMDYINRLPDYLKIAELSPEQKLTEKKKWLDSVKLNALNRLMDRWSEILALELDRLYQSKSEDMIDVCGAIEKLSKSIDREDASML